MSPEETYTTPSERDEGEQQRGSEPASAGDEVDDLQQDTAAKLKNPEVAEIDERLTALVVEPVNALSEAQRTVKGRSS